MYFYRINLCILKVQTPAVRAVRGTCPPERCLTFINRNITASSIEFFCGYCMMHLGHHSDRAHALCGHHLELLERDTQMPQTPISETDRKTPQTPKPERCHRSERHTAATDTHIRDTQMPQTHISETGRCQTERGQRHTDVA